MRCARTSGTRATRLTTAEISRVADRRRSRRSSPTRTAVAGRGRCRCGTSKSARHETTDAASSVSIPDASSVPGQRPVRGAGVEEAEAEPTGDLLRDARLAAAGGAVDRDDEREDHVTRSACNPPAAFGQLVGESHLPPRAARRSRRGRPGAPGECSRRRSSRFTPISPISASRRASSPGRSSTMTTTVVSGVSVPCLPGSRSTPVLPPASSSATARRAPGASGSRERVDEPVEVVAEARRSTSTHRRRVRAEDLHPQFGVAARRCASCRAPPGPRGRSAAFGASTNRRAMRLDDDLRHVRDERDAAVVLLGRHLDGVAPRSRTRSSIGAGAPVRDRVVRGDDPRPPDEQVGARGEMARRARGRPAGGSRCSARGRRRVARARRGPGLDARDVGHDRVGEARRARRATTSAVTSGGTATTMSCGASSAPATPTGAESTAIATCVGDASREDHLDAARAEAERRRSCRAGRRRRRGRGPIRRDSVTSPLRSHPELATPGRRPRRGRS